MTPLLPELSALPIPVTLDGELVAFGSDGAPDFPLLCERMLMRRPGIAVTYMVFDLLSLEGEDLTWAPYFERRAQLEELELNGVFWQTPETFDDGEALFEAVCAHELEGVVAKRQSGRYRPGERGWVKNQEPQLLALGDGARGRDQQTSSEAVRLTVFARLLRAAVPKTTRQTASLMDDKQKRVRASSTPFLSLGAAPKTHEALMNVLIQLPDDALLFVSTNCVFVSAGQAQGQTLPMHLVRGNGSS